MIRIFFLRFSIFLLFFINRPLLQEIPNEFIEFKKIKLRNDNGYNWDEISSFGPIRYQNKLIENDSLNIKSRFGLSLTEKNKSINTFGHFTFKKYFHGYLYLRIVDKPETFSRYSGIPRDINRAGFTSGETDLSGITYEKDWMTIQFGRGRQSWGTGNDIQLAISEKSASYDFGMLDLDFEHLKVRYFHGYLESDSAQVNRYITGRGIEWKNKKNLLISLSEIIIYTGKNRNIDFAYFNPISTHLEIELNQRQNTLNSDSGNGVWQASFDYLTKKKNRISFNYMFDEFIFDKTQIKEGKENFNAFSLRGTWSPFDLDKNIFFFYLSYVKIADNTFRHEDGNNNFIQRNKPLGYYLGSDLKVLNIGFNGFFKNQILTKVTFMDKSIGDNSIINSPYRPYDFSDPYKTVGSSFYLKGDFQWWLKKNFSLFLDFEYPLNSKNKRNSTFNIGLELYSKFIGAL